jgi:hypothetical protein
VQSGLFQNGPIPQVVEVDGHGLDGKNPIAGERRNVSFDTMSVLSVGPGHSSVQGNREADFLELKQPELKAKYSHQVQK